MPACVESLQINTYRIPTEGEESDGTLTWNETILVVVRAISSGVVGTGYTYGNQAIGDYIIPP